ncbi:MAG: CYTH domain-containing protein [Erysipelotrichales bacterium]
MEENIEIEYKQLLDVEEYQKLKTYLKASKEHVDIDQTNYYFETVDFSLGKEKKALRIRVKDDTYELCLKEKRAQDVLEHNYMISKEAFDLALNDPNTIKEYIPLKGDFILLGKLFTNRIELKIKGGLICLDYSKYCNKEDYEIEFEAVDYNKEEFFEVFLDMFDIKYKENKVNKIERFINEYKKMEE